MRIAIPPLLVAWGIIIAPPGLRAGEPDRAKPASTATQQEKIWRVQHQCGINALYVALRLHGREVTYPEVERLLPPGSQGVSMADLRDCAKRFGARANVLRVPAENLSTMPLPLIAHFEEEAGTTGHYVVVLAVGDDARTGGQKSVELIDGTTAIPAIMPLNQYHKKATGYVLVFDKPQPTRWLSMAAAVIGGLTLLLLAVQTVRRSAGFRLRARRTLSSAGSATGPEQHPIGLLLGLGLALSVSGVAAAHEGSRPVAPITLDQLTARAAEVWAPVSSLYVEYDHVGEALDDPAALKRYLRLEYCGVTQHKAFAYKGDQRYLRLTGPRTAARLAPDVEPDWDVVPGGREVKRLRDEQYERDVSLYGKEEVDEAIRKARAQPIPLQQDYEIAFDGKLLRRRLGKDRADIWGRDKIPTDVGWFYQEYLDLLWRPLPDPFDARNDRASQRVPDGLSRCGFELLDGREAVEGEACVVVQRRGEEKIWLAPRFAYAVVKHEKYDPPSGRLLARVVNKDFGKVLGNLWLPHLCWREVAGPPRAPLPYAGKPMLRYVYTVKKLELNHVPDSLFALRIPPGASVMDVSLLPKKDDKFQAVDYYMPADPSQLDDTIRLALADKEVSGAKSRKMQVILLLNGGLVIVVIGLLLVWRYFRTTRDVH